MKITFLGTGAADWNYDIHKDIEGYRRNSSILIDDCFLVDPGSNVINALDKFEGHPYFYYRKEIECRFDNNELVKAYVYFSAGERCYFKKLPLLKKY